jgi:hypothetical protein
MPGIDGAVSGGAGGRAPRLLRASLIGGSVVAATDGEIGGVVDLYLDDESWTVRYLVVDTGRWLPGRRVLILPSCVRAIDVEARVVEVSLTREQVRGAPALDTARPVSRRQETELYQYYGFPYYWTGPYRWGPVGVPTAPGAWRPRDAAGIGTERAQSGEPTLRSAREVRGYVIRATDGELGSVEDALVDEAEWAVRYLIVDPQRWWPGNPVLVAADWITGVSWPDAHVSVNVTRSAVREAPEYDPSGPALDRAYETAFYGHHRQPGYWERQPERWRLWPPAA